MATVHDELGCHSTVGALLVLLMGEGWEGERCRPHAHLRSRQLDDTGYCLGLLRCRIDNSVPSVGAARLRVCAALGVRRPLEVVDCRNIMTGHRYRKRTR